MGGWRRESCLRSTKVVEDRPGAGENVTKVVSEVVLRMLKCMLVAEDGRSAEDDEAYQGSRVWSLNHTDNNQSASMQYQLSSTAWPTARQGRG